MSNDRFLPDLPPQEAAERVVGAGDAAAAVAAVEPRQERAPRVANEQRVALAAELDDHRAESRAEDIDVVRAVVAVDGQVAGHDQVDLDLVGLAPSIDIELLGDVQVVEVQVRDAAAVLNDELALEDGVADLQVVLAAAQVEIGMIADQHGEQLEFAFAGVELRGEIDFVVAVAGDDVQLPSDV